VLISLMLLGCAQETPTQPEGEFSVLTYNVHGLPSVITGDDTLARMELIGPLFDTYELVALQEDFMEEGQALLDAGTILPHRTRFSEVSGPERVYGSGLSTFGFQTVIREEGHYFADCNGVIDGASDCLASKGFQMIWLELDPGLELLLINTHMEAGGGPEDEAARESNVNDLIAAMAAVDSTAPMIFLGDTNLHPDDPVDGPLGKRFESELGLADVCTLLDCDEPNRIDRIYIRSGDAASLEALAWSVPGEFVDAEGVDLSDHNAILAQIRWARTAEAD
jgi:endonuclease/exonuclease/phosphatase family metal-dependent hydrolase